MAAKVPQPRPPAYPRPGPNGSPPGLAGLAAAAPLVTRQAAPSFAWAYTRVMQLQFGPLFASLIVSAVGFVLLHYGRKMARLPPLVVGLAMLIYPYFVPNVLATVLVAVGLLAGLWLAVRLGW